MTVSIIKSREKEVLIDYSKKIKIISFASPGSVSTCSMPGMFIYVDGITSSPCSLVPRRVCLM